MSNKGNILRIDGSAGLIAGIVMWLLSDVLIALYQIPPWLITVNVLAQNVQRHRDSQLGQLV